MNKQSEKVEWKSVMEFSEGDLVVEVRKLPLRRPRFSIAIGQRLADGKVGRYVGVFVNGQGKITVTAIAEKIRALVAQAESYVREEAQKAEDEFIANKQRREQHGGEWKSGEKRRIGTHGRMER